MEDKLNEMKQLIEEMEEDSPLRKALLELLAAEMSRHDGDGGAHDDPVNDGDPQDGSDEGEGKAQDEAEDPDADQPDDEKDTEEPRKELSEKLSDLLEDDEFIAASIGFLIGAVTVGAGAMLVSALRK